MCLNGFQLIKSFKGIQCHSDVANSKLDGSGILRKPSILIFFWFLIIIGKLPWTNNFNLIKLTGTSMAWSSTLGILMKIFPDKVAKVMSWTQTCFGLGYMLGPGVGAALYEQGGFMLPFLVVGSISTILSISLAFTIPNLSNASPEVELGAEQQQLR